MNLMTDMSVAAQTQLNWNVMTVMAGNLDECYAKLEASDHAKAKGGKVVALTVPMAFSVRLSMAGGFVLDALPDWEGAMLAPPAEKMAILSDQAERDRLDELAQQPGPLKGLADWSTQDHLRHLRPPRTSSTGGARWVRSPRTRAKSRSTPCATSWWPTS